MDTTSSLPAAVQAIWLTVLVIVSFVIVPLAIILLQRTLRAALSIRRYMAEMLQAGAGIAGNTAAIAALNDTRSLAGGMIDTAGQLEEHSGTIASVLAERAGQGG